MTGRPTAYRQEFDERAERYALLGLTDVEIAECLGVAESTLHLWKKKHPSFSESITRGKVEADAKVAQSLYHRALGYSHDSVKIFMPAGRDEPVYAEYTEHYPPDTNAARLWLLNRQRGRWVDRHELTGKDGGPIETSGVIVVGGQLNPQQWLEQHGSGQDEVTDDGDSGED